MKKRIFVLLFAALLLVSASSCGGKDNGAETTDSGTGNGVGIVDPSNTGNSGTNGTSAQTSDLTTPPETGSSSIDEPNATFTEVNKQVYVVAENALLRNDTVLNDATKYGATVEGDILTVTGESTNWYRISYPIDNGTKTCYISKAVVGDYAQIEAFTAVEGGSEEIEISMNCNVRSYPSSESDYSVRGQLTKGTKVTRVAIGGSWSRIKFDYKYTNAAGESVTEEREYYVSNSCIKPTESSETTATTVTEAVTATSTTVVE